MFQISYGNSLLFFNLSNKRIIYFAHDVFIGIFAMPMVFSPIFCLDFPFGFSI